MLLRLAAAGLLVLSLVAVAPAPADAACAGVENGGDCIGVYLGCSLVVQCLVVADPYVCVGIYDGTCTGVQKP